MDLSSLTGGKQPQSDKTPAHEYTAQVESPVINGEVKLVMDADGLRMTALFDTADITFIDMSALEFADYTVLIQTADGSFAFSRMGKWAQPFYGALCDAYNKAVMKALFLKGEPILTARGEYMYGENGHTCNGVAPMMIYEDCLCVLPPDMGARRIPLCFLTGMDKGDFELTLRLAEDKYTFRKLGYNTEPFVNTVEKRLRALRDKTLATVRELDTSLSTQQASAISRLIPEGAAAAMGQLAAAAPSFVSMLEARLAAGRAAESYKAFQELCDPKQIYIGFKKNAATDNESDSGGIMDNLSGLLGGLLGGDQATELGTVRDPYMLWMIAPSPSGSACAVEFAGDVDDAAATFIYRFDGDFDSFARQLNIALEAIGFKREVIRLTDEELRRSEYSHYLMATQRNAALQLIRSSFVGRVIHNGAWRQKLEELWSAPAAVTANAEADSPKQFCTFCGEKLQQDVRFCGQCGAKL